ncbi:PDZ domain-containing protein [Trichonephila clavipes]|nr:PDZ domain-containing protein [Trichonephila clavipes]
MRLFKRSSASPPQLLRLSVLEEGGEANPSTAAPGLRLSLPSCFSECNIDELMAYTETRKLEETNFFFLEEFLSLETSGFIISPYALPSNLLICRDLFKQNLESSFASVIHVYIP